MKAVSKAKSEKQSSANRRKRSSQTPRKKLDARAAARAASRANGERLTYRCRRHRFALERNINKLGHMAWIPCIGPKAEGPEEWLDYSGFIAIANLISDAIRLEDPDKGLTHAPLFYRVEFLGALRGACRELFGLLNVAHEIDRDLKKPDRDQFLKGLKGIRTIEQSCVANNRFRDDAGRALDKEDRDQRYTKLRDGVSVAEFLAHWERER